MLRIHDGRWRCAARRGAWVQWGCRSAQQGVSCQSYKIIRTNVTVLPLVGGDEIWWCLGRASMPRLPKAQPNDARAEYSWPHIQPSLFRWKPQATTPHQTTPRIFFLLPAPSSALRAKLLPTFEQGEEWFYHPNRPSSTTLMELSGPTVDDLLRQAEQRLSQNNSAQLARVSDQSDGPPKPQQPAVGDGSKPTVTTALEPRVASTKATQNVSRTPFVLCPHTSHICLCRMMRNHLHLMLKVNPSWASPRHQTLMFLFHSYSDLIHPPPLPRSP